MFFVINAETRSKEHVWLLVFEKTGDILSFSMVVSDKKTMVND